MVTSSGPRGGARAKPRTDRPAYGARGPARAKGKSAKLYGPREAEAEVIAAKRRLEPAAVRRTAAVGAVAPGAAADNPVGARVPSAVENASVDDLAPQAMGIGLADMREQARAAVAACLQVDPTRLVGTLDGLDLLPTVSGKRLSLTANGQVRYQLKTPYRDGTTHVIFEPLGEPKPK